MNKTIYRIASLIMALSMILGSTIHTKAAGSVYYVSPTGNDANPGTATAPFRTFAKANSVLSAGGTLNIYPGVYNQQLKITRSGTASAWITVKPVGGAVVIDMSQAATVGLEVRASFVSVSGLEVRNASTVCVNLLGSNITVNALAVHDCTNHGIQANNSSQIKILNSRVYRTVLSNATRTLVSGWGSAIKIRVSDNVLIQGNTIYNNYGEGMGTRGTNITIRANTVFDNYSVNIYTNSENALIERNFVYCRPNSGFERGGQPATGIAMGEEFFDGWGARLKNARVLNNIVAFCKHGVRYNGAEAGVIGGGLKYSTIAYNTLYGSVNSALSIVYGSAQAGSLVANNIVWQAQNKLTAIDSPVGITFQNNFWKVAPAAAYRSPGDRAGDPRFVTAPGYTAESYRPASGSPAAGAAVNISIASDYYARPRGPAYDMGAIQFAGATTASAAEPTATSTALTVQPTAVQSTVTLPAATGSPAVPTVQATATSLLAPPSPAAPTETATSLPATETATSAPLEPSATATSLPSQPSATATALPTQPAAETAYDNRHSSLVYSAGWVEEISRYALEGSYARTSTDGSSVTLPFSGQFVSIIYKGGPSYRGMDVYLDGVRVATIDQRHDSSTYKARWDFPGQLTAGPHTLRLVFVTTGSSTNGSVDTILVR